jgi:methyltransferase (TIGR00027 family)
MQPGKPSQTALAAASHRAAHQVLDHGRIFRDPLALRILGDEGRAAVEVARDQPAGALMRIFIAARTRFAEDALAAALNRGVRQVVVLAAGLDTSAYRNEWPGVRVFEVDHPDTQAWKRGMLESAGITPLSALTYAPIDFERQTLAEALAGAGFDEDAQTFFIWLGCTPYLSKEAVWATCAFVGALPGGGHVVFDYAMPLATIDDADRAELARTSARVAEVGEPWISFFEPQEVATGLWAAGFTDIEDIGRSEIDQRYLGLPANPDAKSGGRIVRASQTR